MPLAYPDTVKAEHLGVLDQPQRLFMTGPWIRGVELADGQEPEAGALAFRGLSWRRRYGGSGRPASHGARCLGQIAQRKRVVRNLSSAMRTMASRRWPIFLALAP